MLERSVAVVCLLCLVFAGAVLLAREDEDWPFLDVRVPLELYEDGAVKTEIRADAAGMPDGGITHAKGVEVVLYSPDGEQEARFEGERCRYDRAARRVESDGPVRLESGNVVVVGRGLRWDAQEEHVRILHDVRVTFRGQPQVELEGE